MRRFAQLPGVFGDVAAAVNSDEWIAVTSDSRTRAFFGSGVEFRPVWDVPTQLGFLRCAAGVSTIVAAGQRQSGDLEVLINGQRADWLSTGLAFGQNPVALVWVGGDNFTIGVMRSNVALELIAFDAVRGQRISHHRDVRDRFPEGTSQGLLQLDAQGQPIFTDQARARVLPDGRTTGYLPHVVGSWVAAQGNDDRLLVTDGHVVETVYRGETFEPHLALLRHGAHVACCRSTGAVIVVPDLLTLTADMPVVVIDPVVIPEPQQPPPDGGERPKVPMPDLSRVRSILEATWRAMGSPSLGADSSRESRNAFFLSFCAVMHHGHPTLNPGGGDPRWGSKRADSGRPQSDDVLAWRTGPDQPDRDQFAVDFLGWDLIPGAGANGWHFVDPHGQGEELRGQLWIRPPQSSLPAGGSSAGSGAGGEISPSAAVIAKAADRVDSRYRSLRESGHDAQREWVGRVAWLLNAWLKTDRFGRKRADSQRPISRNVLAERVDGGFAGVSLINETTAAREFVPIGTLRNQIWLPPPDFSDMADLVPETPGPDVPPAGGGTSKPQDPVSPVKPGATAAEIEAALARTLQPMQRQLDTMLQSLVALAQAVADLAGKPTSVERVIAELQSLTDMTAERVQAAKDEIVNTIRSNRCRLR